MIPIGQLVAYHNEAGAIRWGRVQGFDESSDTLLVGYNTTVVVRADEVVADAISMPMFEVRVAEHRESCERCKAASEALWRKR